VARRPGKSFTIMIVPHSESSVWSFNVSLTAVQVIASLLITGCLALLVFANLYADMRANMAELSELRVVAKEQRMQLDYLAAETNSMQSDLDRLHELDRQIRELIKGDKTFGKLATAIEPPADAQQQTSNTLLALAARGPQVSRAADLFGRSDSAVAAENAVASLAQMRSDVAALSQRLQDAQQVLAARNAFLQAKPSIWPTIGYITSGFGYRRSPFGWGISFHDGIDIAAEYGTPVVATGDGVVVSAGWDGALGRAVEIDHGYGYRTVYGHNSRIAVRVGQRVHKGQVIAYVGSTGRSTGPHVHYKVYVNGRLVDPRDYLR